MLLAKYDLKAHFDHMTMFCLSGLQSCSHADFGIVDISADQFVLDIDLRKEEAIGLAVDKLNIDQVLKSRKVVYDVNQFAHLPVRECSAERAAIWEEILKLYPISPELRLNGTWARVAIDATHRTIKAFRLARVPLILAWGTLLGWYRQCNIISGTSDIDLMVPIDYIVSEDHFRLLKVCESCVR